jgi:hypothetical protein
MNKYIDSIRMGEMTPLYFQEQPSQGVDPYEVISALKRGLQANLGSYSPHFEQEQNERLMDRHKRAIGFLDRCEKKTELKWHQFIRSIKAAILANIMEVPAASPLLAHVVERDNREYARLFDEKYRIPNSWVD